MRLRRSVSVARSGLPVIMLVSRGGVLGCASHLPLATFTPRLRREILRLVIFTPRLRSTPPLETSITTSNPERATDTLRRRRILVQTR